jgi:hypothetical protein
VEFAQIRISFAHFLPIIGRISGIRQGSDDVGDDKPPFVVLHRAADFAFLKQRNAGFRIAVGFIHNESSVFMAGDWSGQGPADCFQSSVFS